MKQKSYHLRKYSNIVTNGLLLFTVLAKQSDSSCQLLSLQFDRNIVIFIRLCVSRGFGFNLFIFEFHQLLK